MRVITWNMNKATNRRKESWEYLLELNPDVALLQEVNSIPDFIQNEFECLRRALFVFGKHPPKED
jgi:exonuclease III